MRRVSSFAIAIAASIGILAVPSTATADSGPSTATADSGSSTPLAKSPQGVQAASKSWSYYQTYQTEANCTSAGRYLALAAGGIEYKCQATWGHDAPVRWALYIRDKY